MTSRTNYRWSKFVWKDWASDAALRSCSLAARGLWMDLLCLCHDGEPRGYLTIGGRAPNAGEIAKLIGAHYHLVVKLLGELERQSVFSRTDDGVIYSRRLVRDDERSVAAREYGRAGGNPVLTRGVTQGVTGGVTGGVTAKSHRGNLGGHLGGNPKLKRGGSKANGAGGVNPPVKASLKPDSDSRIQNLESPSPTPHPASGGGAKRDLLNAVKDAANAAAPVPLEAVRRRPFRVIAGAAG